MDRKIVICQLVQTPNVVMENSSILIFSMEYAMYSFTENMENKVNRKEMVQTRKAEYEMRPRNSTYWYWSVTRGKTECKLV
jgi:hypothetical protein